jgi:hypothetical protein
MRSFASNADDDIEKAMLPGAAVPAASQGEADIRARGYG